jgi:heme/copper-type cytochrome/quinol oxidase subunit 3
MASDASEAERAFAAPLATGLEPPVGLGRAGMWVFLATDLVGFAGLLAARAALEARRVGWRPTADRLDLVMGLSSTAVLIASGVTLGPVRGWGADSDSAGRGPSRLRLGATAGLGLLFLLLQCSEYARLLAAHRMSLTGDHGAALFFVLTGYHGLHVAVGVVWLLCLAARRSAPPGAVAAGVTVAALYWQFVDLVWVVLFPALYLGKLAGALGVGLAGLLGLATTRLGRERGGVRLMMATTVGLCVAMVLVLTLEYGVRAASAGGPP